jgi:cytochrome c oxidase cbb3-type subunit 3
MSTVREHAPDGIEEYDNPLPRWWLYGFYLTIVFGAIYAVFYPSLWCWDGTMHWSSSAQWERQVADNARLHPAAVATTSPGDNLEVTSKDATVVADGRAIFLKNCAPCHGDNAEGRIGLSLHDHDWRYGGDEVSILQTIRGGRPGGMPVWGKVLPNEQIQHVAAYVYTLSKSHPPPKTPAAVGAR